MTTKRQLIAAGLSTADVCRLANISYGRLYYYLTGATSNLTEAEQKRVIEVVAVALGNTQRMEAVAARGA